MAKARKKHNRLTVEEHTAVALWMMKNQDWCRAQKEWSTIADRIKSELDIVATADNLTAIGRHKDINIKLGNNTMHQSEMQKLKAIVENIAARLSKVEGN